MLVIVNLVKFVLVLLLFISNCFNFSVVKLGLIDSMSVVVLVICGVVIEVLE